MSGVPGVVFDLDGVLVASEHLWELGWEEVAATRNVVWSAANTRACQGKSVPEWADYIADLTGLPSDHVRDHVVGYVVASYDSGEVTLLPYAADLVAGACARGPIGLATSAPREVIDRVLRFPELTGRFTATVSSAEVPRGKPSPDVYLAAIDRCGLAAHRSLAVEDSSNGIRAAAAAGLKVVGMEHAQYPVAPDARALAVAVYGSLRDVADHIFSALDREVAR